MKLSRKGSLIIHYFLDQLLPPAIRDADWFILPLFRMLFGKKDRIFSEWKEKAPALSDEQFSQSYRQVQDVLIERHTSLNDACLEEIKKAVIGDNLLEAGCGNGYLSGILSGITRVTGLDIIISDEARKTHPAVEFVEGKLEQLPWPDKHFDTVVSTHTLEHVVDLPAAMRELRRVTRSRLILVTPKQRPYRYTFDLHLNFFPYPHSLVQAVGKSTGSAECRVVAGDLFYVENCQEGL